MAICYNTVYNTLTSAFEVHGGFLDDDEGMVEHTCGYQVNTDSTINPLLVLSANSQYGITSANTDLDTAVTSSVQSTSGTPNIENLNINEVNEMRVQLVIRAVSPVIKGDYRPIPVTKPSGVVKR